MTAIRKALSLLTVLLAIVAAHGATWKTIDVPGAQQTEAFGINEGGDIVGSYLDPGNVVHGYRLSAGVFKTIDVPGAILTGVYGINDQGQMVGSFTSSDHLNHGFLLDGENFTILDFPGAFQTYANGINNASDIVGTYADDQNNVQGFEWSEGNFTTIDLPGSPFTALNGINRLGQVVGVYEDSNFRQHSFLLNQDGTFKTFQWKYAGDINDHKVIVGRKGSNGIRYNVKTKTAVQIRFPHSASTDCIGINNVGQIVGDYVDSTDHRHGYLRTP